MAWRKPDRRQAPRALRQRDCLERAFVDQIADDAARTGGGLGERRLRESKATFRRGDNARAGRSHAVRRGPREANANPRRFRPRLKRRCLSPSAAPCRAGSRSSAPPNRRISADWREAAEYRSGSQWLSDLPARVSLDAPPTRRHGSFSCRAALRQNRQAPRQCRAERDRSRDDQSRPAGGPRRSPRLRPSKWGCRPLPFHFGGCLHDFL